MKKVYEPDLFRLPEFITFISMSGASAPLPMNARLKLSCGAPEKVWLELSLRKLDKLRKLEFVLNSI